MDSHVKTSVGSQMDLDKYRDIVCLIKNYRWPSPPRCCCSQSYFSPRPYSVIPVSVNVLPLLVCPCANKTSGVSNGRKHGLVLIICMTVSFSSLLHSRIESPFLVMALREIEIVNLERVGPGKKILDMSIVLKEYNKAFLRIDSILSTSLDGNRK
ncbi:hypothetical protein L2E82_30196 [Cichorium intybus]|uniref:Uncharacterized protein n=1 Tax=Cichorium intybus TaxID=13427 RepID=A0ACB9CZQ0_CICIN|nr:hypothetical protein L2E82_30196 [Cichorium intybus]